MKDPVLCTESLDHLGTLNNGPRSSGTKPGLLHNSPTIGVGSAAAVSPTLLHPQKILKNNQEPGV
jgi:hypothetical protein